MTTDSTTTKANLAAVLRSVADGTCRAWGGSGGSDDMPVRKRDMLAILDRLAAAERIVASARAWRDAGETADAARDAATRLQEHAAGLARLGHDFLHAHPLVPIPDRAIQYQELAADWYAQARAVVDLIAAAGGEA